MKKMLAPMGLLLFPLLLAAAVPPTYLAAAPTYEEELHYFLVIPEQPGAVGDRVQVMEFFWYGCSHCYSFEPYLKQWLKDKPDNVDFIRIPAMFNRPGVVMQAKTFYALKMMGMAGEFNDKIFYAMHVEKQPLRTREEMETLLAREGLDMDAYRKAMKSFAVQTQARRAAVLADRFDVRGVPAIVVDGKYRTGGLGGDIMIDLTQYLIELVRKEKGAS